jgi:hypothetical protein
VGNGEIGEIGEKRSGVKEWEEWDGWEECWDGAIWRIWRNWRKANCAMVADAGSGGRVESGAALALIGVRNLNAWERSGWGMMQMMH